MQVMDRDTCHGIGTVRRNGIHVGQFSLACGRRSEPENRRWGESRASRRSLEFSFRSGQGGSRDVRNLALIEGRMGMFRCVG